MTRLAALASSFANGDLEGELRQLFIQLYDEFLGETAEEVDHFGMPHLGPFGLVQRSISQDGLSVLGQISESSIRYLFKAWRYRNPRRGTLFLEIYLRVLFGNVFQVNQLWQKKSEPYPTYLRSLDEISMSGESESDFFLTSRLRIDLSADLVPDQVVISLRAVVAARFVLEVRVSQTAKNTLGLGGVLSLSNFFMASGES